MARQTYRVEALTAESEDGVQTWETAARWGDPGEQKRMDYGLATGLTREQAEHNVRRINASSGVSDGMARIVEEVV